MTNFAAHTDPFYGVTYNDMVETIDQMDREHYVRQTASWPRPAYVSDEPYTASEIRCARIARCIVATWDALERNFHGSRVPLNITGGIRVTAKVFEVMILGFARNAEDRKQLFERLKALKVAKPTEW